MRADGAGATPRAVPRVGASLLLLLVGTTTGVAVGCHRGQAPSPPSLAATWTGGGTVTYAHRNAPADEPSPLINHPVRVEISINAEPAPTAPGRVRFGTRSGDGGGVECAGTFRRTGDTLTFSDFTECVLTSDGGRRLGACPVTVDAFVFGIQPWRNGGLQLVPRPTHFELRHEDPRCGSLEQRMGTGTLATVGTFAH